jgi:putative cell wall-binding protein
MKKTKKALASLAIAGMVLSMAPASVFAADSNRISGVGRVETAIAIANDGWTTSDSVIVVPADDANIVDALAAAPLAGQLNAPILITYKGALDAKVKEEIVALKATKVYAIGALSADVVNALKGISGVTVTQLQGSDRVDTAAKVAAQLTDVKGTFVVAYEGKADALSVASYAAAKDYSIVIAQPDGSVAGAELADTVYTVGGQVTVPGATALKGVDRYATNNEVVNSLDFDFDTVYVANGQSLVDALAGAPLAAKTNSPIVLADSVGVATGVNDDLTASSKVIALGGAGAVSDVVLGKIAYKAPASLEVESVKALNAKQIAVKFTKAVDENSAEASASYKVYDKAGALKALAADESTSSKAAQLQSDDKTVVLTLAAPITEETDLTVVVTKAIYADDDNSEYAPLYSTVLTVDDETAPTVTKVESKTKEDSTDKVTITFSEPVSAAAIKIDGKSVSSITWSKYNTQAAVVTTDEFDSATSHKLEVVNVTDFANNVNTLISQNFSVTKDTVAPTIVSLTQYSDKEVLVKFSKKMTASTVTLAGNITGVNSSLAPLTVATTAEANDDSGTEFVVSLSPVSYADDDNTETFTLAFSDNITDSLGNELATTTRQVTLTEDTTGPEFSSVKVVKNSAGEVVRLELKFNESVGAAVGLSDKLSIVDKNGVAVAYTDLLPNETANPALSVDGSFTGGKTLKLNLSPSTKLVDKYTFTFKKGFVKDTSSGTNDSKAYTTTIDFGAADAEKFELTGTVITPVSTNSFKVNFGRQVKGGDVSGSATSRDRYTLNGSVLPEGTSITLNTGRTEATITLPSSSVSATDASAIFTIIGVQDLDGNVVTPYTTTVAVADNIKPVLQSASLYSYTNTTPYQATILLTFNENVAVAGDADGAADEFTIKVGGTVKAISAATVAPVAGKSKQLSVTFTFATALDTNKTITIETEAATGTSKTDYKDNAGNAPKTDVTVTVAK